MKKITALLLIFCFMFFTSACSDNADTKRVQNRFSVVSDLSEVYNYFDKTLLLRIDELYSFRFYDYSYLFGYNFDIIQYQETETSSIKYIGYNGCTSESPLSYTHKGYFDEITETVLSSQIVDNNEFTLSKLSYPNYYYDEIVDYSEFYIVKDRYGKILRYAPSNDLLLNITCFSYNSDDTISEINTYYKTKSDEAFDITKSFDNANVNVKYTYDSSELLQSVNKEDSHWRRTDTFAYDQNGLRKSQMLQQGHDGTEYKTEYVEYYRDNDGTVNKIYAEQNPFDEKRPSCYCTTYDVIYSSDGTIASSNPEWREKE